MKFWIPRPALSLAVCIAIASAFACQEGSTSSTQADTTHPDPTRAIPRSEALDRSSRLGALRARAGASFAEIERGAATSRAQSRIGPQPWPSDLPMDWPEPDRAVLLADTRRGEDARLLLIDLPDAPEDALSRYREALAERGFETRQPQTRRDLHALHARHGQWEAVLTFVDRDRRTRLEILFIDLAAG